MQVSDAKKALAVALVGGVAAGAVIYHMSGKKQKPTTSHKPTTGVELFRAEPLGIDTSTPKKRHRFSPSASEFVPRSHSVVEQQESLELELHSLAEPSTSATFLDEFANLSWSEEVEKAQYREHEFSDYSYNNRKGRQHSSSSQTMSVAEEEMNTVFENKRMLDIVSELKEQDRPGSFYSWSSNDSGKGSSPLDASLASPINLGIDIEVPPMYEFEVPQDIVGLLIGRNGFNIKYLMEKSNCHIVIRRHIYSDRHKICTLEGTKEEITECLKLIRRRLPPSRFPELKLEPLAYGAYIPTTPLIIEAEEPQMSQLPLPVGVRFSVAVSSVVSPDFFFVQQPADPSYAGLASLEQEMNKIYSQGVINDVPVPDLPKEIEVGAICVCPIDKRWYRVMVNDVCPDEECCVKLLDYGGYLKTSLHDMKKIRCDFLKLPFQAKECVMTGIKAKNYTGSWSVESVEKFVELTQGKILDAEVVGYTTDFNTVVQLFDYDKDRTSVLISDAMIESEHADAVPVMYAPNLQNPLLNTSFSYSDDTAPSLSV